MRQPITGSWGRGYLHSFANSQERSTAPLSTATAKTSFNVDELCLDFSRLQPGADTETQTTDLRGSASLAERDPPSTDTINPLEELRAPSPGTNPSKGVQPRYLQAAFAVGALALGGGWILSDWIAEGEKPRSYPVAAMAAESRRPASPPQASLTTIATPLQSATASPVDGSVPRTPGLLKESRGSVSQPDVAGTVQKPIPLAALPPTNETFADILPTAAPVIAEDQITPVLRADVRMSDALWTPSGAETAAGSAPSLPAVVSLAKPATINPVSVSPSAEQKALIVATEPKTPIVAAAPWVEPDVAALRRRAAVLLSQGDLASGRLFLKRAAHLGDQEASAQLSKLPTPPTRN